jgi:uncharacterized FlaG/YvyC family protein
MEVKLPLGGALHPNFSQNAASYPFAPRAVSGVPDVKADRAEQKAFELNEGDLHELLQRTIELVSVFERNLKFEIIKDADIVQIQVIDSRDGMVVRKIPPDEVVKLVTYIKNKLSDNMNVLA